MTEFEYKLELAKAAVTKGKLSRRDFTKFALAGGLTLTSANALFVRAAKAQAKPGGHFRAGLGHGATTDTFDPATWAHGMAGSPSRHARNPLITPTIGFRP